MSVSSLIADLSRQDVQLWMQDEQLHFDAPKGVVTEDVLTQLRQNKPEILKYLTERSARLPLTKPIESPDQSKAEERRQQLHQRMAADDQGKKYFCLSDTEADPEFVILAMAIRGVATFEMRIPREKYDPFLLADVVKEMH